MEDRTRIEYGNRESRTQRINIWLAKYMNRNPNAKIKIVCVDPKRIEQREADIFVEQIKERLR